MLFFRFQQCVNMLREHVVAELLVNRNSLVDQKNTLITEKERASRDLKIVATNSVKANGNLTSRKNQILQGDLQTYKANLRMQQQRGLDTKASLLTVARIIEKNKEIQLIDNSVRDNELKVTNRAKILAKVIRDLDTVDQEIGFMDDCQAVNTYLGTEGLLASAVADYEVERLYYAFSTEVS